jgi:subtilisin family serine protease
VALGLLAPAFAAAPAPARAPNDPGFTSQYSLGMIGAPAAWDLTTGAPSILVAHVDDGVNFSQADLAPNLVAGHDFGNNDDDPAESGSIHGSQTASILGARGDNGIGMAGIDWNVSIMPLKVRTDGPGTRFDNIAPSAVASAFTYAADQGARVVTASFGLRSTTTAAEAEAVRQSIARAPNTLFVTSAGNIGRDNDAQPRYPCSYDLPNLICVAASDKSDQLWSSSNYGAKSVDLAAPGVQIFTVVGTNAYGMVDGTSYAAPMVSGVAALYLSSFPYASAADVRAAILGGVDVKPAFRGKVATGGRLNAARTLAIAPATPPPPPPAPAPPPQPAPVAPPAPVGPTATQRLTGGLVLRVAGRRGLRDVVRHGLLVRVTVHRTSRIRLSLRLSRADARRLHVRTVVARTGSRRVSGTRPFRLRLHGTARRRIAARRRVALALVATVGSGKRAVTTRRAVVLVR